MPSKNFDRLLHAINYRDVNTVSTLLSQEPLLIRRQGVSQFVRWMVSSLDIGPMEEVLTLLIKRGWNVNATIRLQDDSEHSFLKLACLRRIMYNRLSLNFFDILYEKNAKFLSEVEYDEFKAQATRDYPYPQGLDYHDLQNFCEYLDVKKDVFLAPHEPPSLTFLVADFIVKNRIPYEQKELSLSESPANRPVL